MKRLALIALTLTASCGGVATNGADFEPDFTPPQPIRTFAQVESDRQALLRETQVIPVSRASDLPPSGRFFYAGTIATQLRPREQVVGDLDLTVNFGGAGSVSGVAYNFINTTNQRYTGDLDVFNGTFDATPNLDTYQSSAGLRGILTAPDRTNLSVSARLDGDVLGRFGEAYEGVVSGEVKYDGFRNKIEGGVVAVRQ